MKPAVDEMFPEGAGPYVDLDEVGVYTWFSARNSTIRRVSLSLHTLKKISNICDRTDLCVISFKSV